jgi:hypothetical protein
MRERGQAGMDGGTEAAMSGQVVIAGAKHKAAQFK